MAGEISTSAKTEALFTVKKHSRSIHQVACSPLKIVIYGTAYVQRLNSFLNSPHGHSNLDLDETLCQVTCWHGHGGLQVRSEQHDSIFRQLDIVYLHIGSNDIAESPDTLPDEVATTVMTLASLLMTRYHPKCVIVSQLLPRFLEPFDGFNAKIKVLNARLMELCKEANFDVSFWRHRAGLWQPQQHIYADDGIHLSDTVGNNLFMRSIRDALLRHIRWYCQPGGVKKKREAPVKPVDSASVVSASNIMTGEGIY